MPALYLVNHSVVRFWDTRHPTDAVLRPGDLEVCCADCVVGKLALMLSHPGVTHLHWKEVDYDIVKPTCSRCGAYDPQLDKKTDTLFRRVLRLLR